MKIFVRIPLSVSATQAHFKVAAVKAIRNLSDPIMSLKDAKDIVETPGWHHIPNAKVRGISPFMQLLDQELQSSVSVPDCHMALRGFGANLRLYHEDQRPVGYVHPDDRPTTSQQYMDTLGNMLRNTEGAPSLEEYVEATTNLFKDDKPEEAPSPKEYVEATQAIRDHLKSKPEDITRQIHAAMVHELKHNLLKALDLREYKMAKFIIDQIAYYDSNKE